MQKYAYYYGADGREVRIPASLVNDYTVPLEYKTPDTNPAEWVSVDRYLTFDASRLPLDSAPEVVINLMRRLRRRSMRYGLRVSSISVWTSWFTTLSCEAAIDGVGFPLNGSPLMPHFTLFFVPHAKDLHRADYLEDQGGAQISLEQAAQQELWYETMLFARITHLSDFHITNIVRYFSGVDRDKLSFRKLPTPALPPLRQRLICALRGQRY